MPFHSFMLTSAYPDDVCLRFLPRAFIRDNGPDESTRLGRLRESLDGERVPSPKLWQETFGSEILGVTPGTSISESAGTATG